MAPEDAQPAPLRLAALISGGGQTMVNLAERIRDGHLDAEIVAVIASNPRAAGVGRAQALGLPTEVVHRKTFESPDAFSEAVWERIRASGADLAVLAGFLSLLRIPDEYFGRVMNVHPALLPCFGGQGMYGRRVHEAVLSAGCKVSGCTVHFADNAYDRGPIITQRCCPVAEGDTPESLAERVQAEERVAYPEAIRLFQEGRLRIEGQVVRVHRG